MGLRFFRPTSSGVRHTIIGSFAELDRRKPEKDLVCSNHRVCGRNHRGVITLRHHGGGHKRLYRKVDFRRKKLIQAGCVHSIEYDPNRNARLALILYRKGEKKYVLAPRGLQVGQTIVAGFRVPIKVGNALPLWKIPSGTSVHNVEFYPGSGGKLSRSAGTSAQIIGCGHRFATLRLPSGEVRMVPETCWGTIGQVGNIEARNKSLGKAGRIRWIGRRPSVRGSAINPVDHPHGGGEGRCPIGRSSPITPWGKVRLGKRTRRPKKYSDALILRRKKLSTYVFIWFVR